MDSLGEVDLTKILETHAKDELGDMGESIKKQSGVKYKEDVKLVGEILDEISNSSKSIEQVIENITASMQGVATIKNIIEK